MTQADFFSLVEQSAQGVETGFAHLRQSAHGFHRCDTDLRLEAGVEAGLDHAIAQIPKVPMPNQLQGMHALSGRSTFDGEDEEQWQDGGAGFQVAEPGGFHQGCQGGRGVFAEFIGEGDEPFEVLDRSLCGQELGQSGKGWAAPVAGLILQHGPCDPGGILPGGLLEEKSQLASVRDGEFALLKSGKPPGLQGVRTLAQGGFQEAIGGCLQHAGRHCHGLGGLELAGGHHCLQAHARVGVSDRFLERAQRFLQAVVPPSHHPGGVGSGERFPGAEELVEEADIDHLKPLVEAERLEEVVLETGIVRVEGGYPGGQLFFQASGNLRVVVAVGEDHAQPLAFLEGSGLESIQQVPGRQLIILRLFHGLLPLGRDAPDPAVLLVPVGMAQGSLVVPDDGIIPIGNVEGAVGAGLDIDGAEALVVRAPERIEQLALVSGPVGSDLQAIDEMGEVSRDHDVALQVVREGGGIDDLADHALDPGAADIERLMAVFGVDHDRQEFAHRVAVALGEGFAPVSVRKTPGVLAAASPEGVQLHAPGPEAPDPVLIHAHDAPGRFHPGEIVQTLAEEKFSAGGPGEGIDVLVGVTGSEAGEENLTGIRPVVPVFIPQEEEILALSEIDSTVADRKSGGHVQAVCEDQRFVHAAIPVVVLQDEELVAGGLGGESLRIDEGAEHPQAAPGTPAHRDGIGDAIFLGRKERDFVACGDLKGREFGSGGVVPQGGANRVILLLSESHGGIQEQEADEDLLLHLTPSFTFQISASACSMSGMMALTSSGNQRGLPGRWSLLLGTCWRLP